MSRFNKWLIDNFNSMINCCFGLKVSFVFFFSFSLWTHTLRKKFPLLRILFSIFFNNVYSSFYFHRWWDTMTNKISCECSFVCMYLRMYEKKVIVLRDCSIRRVRRHLFFINMDEGWVQYFATSILLTKKKKERKKFNKWTN